MWNHTTPVLYGWSRDWDRLEIFWYLSINSKAYSRMYSHTHSPKFRSKISYNYFENYSLHHKHFCGHGAQGFFGWAERTWASRGMCFISGTSITLLIERSFWLQLFLAEMKARREKEKLWSSAPNFTILLRRVKDSDSSFCNPLHHKWVDFIRVSGILSNSDPKHCRISMKEQCNIITTWEKQPCTAVCIDFSFPRVWLESGTLSRVLCRYSSREIPVRKKSFAFRTTEIQRSFQSTKARLMKIRFISDLMNSAWMWHLHMRWSKQLCQNRAPARPTASPSQHLWLFGTIESNQLALLLLRLGYIQVYQYGKLHEAY